MEVSADFGPVLAVAAGSFLWSSVSPRPTSAGCAPGLASRQDGAGGQAVPRHAEGRPLLPQLRHPQRHRGDMRRVRSDGLAEHPGRIERRPITHPDAQFSRPCRRSTSARYGSRDDSPIDPRDFEDPLGQFFVGYLDDEPVATGAWRRSSVRAMDAEVTAEVKRMYVVPRAQRRRCRAPDVRPPRGDRRRRGRRGARPGDGDQAARGDRALRVVGLRAASPGSGTTANSGLSRCFARVDLPTAL